MSYNKTNWNSGDIITAEKLNNIESGIEDASSNEFIRVVEVDPNTETVLGGVTWEELTDNTSDLYTKGQTIKLKNVYDNSTYINPSNFVVFGSDDQSNPTRVIATDIFTDLAYNAKNELVVFGVVIAYVEFYMNGEDLKYTYNDGDYLIPVPEEIEG